MMEELGAGFFLAMHDLEIRGAGEVLGESQSGEMQEVGFTLYADMLANAVRSLKDGREPDLSAPLRVTAEINLHAPALLPADYCPDVHERLVLYKRLANCDTLEELEALHEELVDRFGLLPEPARPCSNATACGSSASRSASPASTRPPMPSRSSSSRIRRSTPPASSSSSRAGKAIAWRDRTGCGWR